MPPKSRANPIPDKPHIIKPLVGFKADLARQVGKYPFEKNVFLMLRFRQSNQALSDFIIAMLREAGLNGVRADQPEWNLTNNVYNPIAVLYCCKYGIALFDETEPNQAYNPNVIYELAMMQSLGRDCLILRNDALPPVPFDLIKDLYMPYKSDLGLVRANLSKWLARIVPHAYPPPEREGEMDVLERTLAADQSRQRVTVNSRLEEVSAECGWQVASRGKRAWRIAANITLLNSGAREGRARVEVYFLDGQGFALDHTSLQDVHLPVGESLKQEISISMSPSLGERVQRALLILSPAE